MPFPIAISSTRCTWASRATSGGTIDEAQAKTILKLIKRAKVGPKFLKYMRARSVEETGSLEAAVATIAVRGARLAVADA